MRKARTLTHRIDAFIQVFAFALIALSFYSLISTASASDVVEPAVNKPLTIEAVETAPRLSLVPAFSIIEKVYADEQPAPPSLEVPDQDIGMILLNVLQNYKSMSPLALGMAAIMLIMQLLKRAFGDFRYKRVVVTVLAVAYATMLAITQGMGFGAAIVAVLITGGGAVALYEAWKGIAKVAKVS